MVYRVDEIKIPEISDYYSVFVCAHTSLSPIIGQKNEPILIFIPNTSHWQCITAGRLPTNIYEALKDYFIYESEQGAIVQFSKMHPLKANDLSDFVHNAMQIAKIRNMNDPAIIFWRDRSVVIGYVADIPEQNDFLLIEAVPKRLENQKVHHEVVEIDGFWEIVSYVITAEKDESFIFKLRLDWRW